MTLANVFLAFIAVSSRFQIVAASTQSTLYRDYEINFGNLKQDFEKSLSVERVASIFVKDPELACSFKCVGEPRCLSINVASQGDSKGLYLCELLSTDKYRAKNMLRTNASFHHYSFMSPCESNPCQNNGICVPDFQHNSYRCDCMAGFAGTYCQVCKFDFEDGIDGWVKTGTAFDNQPTYSDNSAARGSASASQQGDWWIGGFENRPSAEIPGGQVQGDAPQGTLTMPSFKITGQYVSFLIGGSCNMDEARAELIVSSLVVRNTTGKCAETMVREAWDVQEFIGQRAHVNLVDVSSTGWGHINFDDLKGDISCENN